LERLDARPIATGRTMTDLVGFLNKNGFRK